ncbi:hypothetical protein Skr01_13880 [Sphaerisporangium krabiense]|uniref:RHS repeat-associated protein n=1 Tax=Sphaerisporangium krabiense TaxID=763782 RepID=A0A7W8YZM3_9ACTN|nr:DUF4951 domain-containing protein [Sphaerisporangium krabiense]MBB5624736.1 RHS repeat-associated protein [Sphaerisporangium krabiense]GII61303.1 hypothetical protein Skr01_13880 [Sphaerisporangium krabiense]
MQPLPPPGAPVPGSVSGTDAFGTAFGTTSGSASGTTSGTAPGTGAPGTAAAAVQPDGPGPSWPQGPAAPPALSVPKGGGAIRGLGEKFSANPATGTGTLTVPIPTTPGRSGFGPRLALHYDSVAGNGPVGLGWTLGLPMITRKTDKGLPRYQDATPGSEGLSGDGEDVFVLSGAEDLVPVLSSDGARWRRRPVHRMEGGRRYRVERYRPRVEGQYARVERWTAVESGEQHWRTITADGVTHHFGLTARSRIADPDAPGRVFTWLLSRSHDTSGNLVLYEYKPEDDAGVDLGLPHERRRSPAARTANRYLKRVRYGNRTPYTPTPVPDPHESTPSAGIDGDLARGDVGEWLFEVVLDYGEHDGDAPTPREDREWSRRADPFSSYRAGFEVRTYRLCRRVLMFHHFPGEPGVGEDCLVRATELAYRGDPGRGERVLTVLEAVRPWGYRRRDDGGYVRRGMPPVEFGYATHGADTGPHVADPGPLATLPGAESVPPGTVPARWADLDGDGLPGILADQGGTWFYAANLGEGRFAAPRQVATLPSGAALPGWPAGPALRSAARRAAASATLADLDGDGRLEFVRLSGPAPGYVERDGKGGWSAFAPFERRPTADVTAPYTQLADLTGDGLADLLVTQDDGVTWYPGRGLAGFDPARRAFFAGADPLTGVWEPLLLHTDPTEAVYLADMSGDGLADLVRVRPGEVRYHPNLGYGRFGSAVVMDHSPWLDGPGAFDQRRVRLADVDGSGTTDLLYLHADGVHIYPNAAGNAFADRRVLGPGFPRADSLADVAVLDLLGRGTACLVWWSPLPVETGRRLRYLDLTGGVKPHLLTRVRNNLGAETLLTYASSTRFGLADRAAGRPWRTRLPFPVHVVERVEVRDLITRTRRVSRYVYHDGRYDGEEREFTGFGMVEQYDDETFPTPSGPGGELRPPDPTPTAGDAPVNDHAQLAENPAHQDDAWTGRAVPGTGHARISGGPLGGERSLLGEAMAEQVSPDISEYVRVPPVLTRTWFHTGDPDLTLPDPFPGDPPAPRHAIPSAVRLPGGQDVPWPVGREDDRQAWRALRGVALRRETYGLDGAAAQEVPYESVHSAYTVELLQPRTAGQPYAVLARHPRETVTVHRERGDDPRIGHELVLAVDDFGQATHTLTAAYGRHPGAGRRTAPELSPEDVARQQRTHLMEQRTEYTNAVDGPDAYRAPQPAQRREAEILGLRPTGPLFTLKTLTTALRDPSRLQEVPFTEWDTGARLGEVPSAEWDTGARLEVSPAGWDTGARLEEVLPAAWEAGARAAARPARREVGRARIFYRADDLGGRLPLGVQESRGLPDQAYRLALTPDVVRALYGGRVDGAALAAAGYAADEHGWWTPSGRARHAPPGEDELAAAVAHFFVPRVFLDPFDAATTVDYDRYDLLPLSTRDALGNVASAGERDAEGRVRGGGLDYRVLQPRLISDPNGNRVAVAFDARGLVAGTAILGRADDPTGDSLDGFDPDPDEATVLGYFADPRDLAGPLLGRATGRLLTDPFAFARDRDAVRPHPPAAAALARERHAGDLGAESPVQQTFTYSDGFGREIQTKSPAEPAPDRPGQARWAGSGWTVFTTKGKPLRTYEPFFSPTHLYEPDRRHGVSSVRCYDALERVVALLHPDGTWSKQVLAPWRQVAWDVNDTVLLDPARDPDVGGLLAPLVRAEERAGWRRWYPPRASGELGPQERRAALLAAGHAATPVTTDFDALARACRVVAHNRLDPDPRGPAGADSAGRAGAVDVWYATRNLLDAEGTVRAVVDPLGRTVARNDVDLLSRGGLAGDMDAGERRQLLDVTGVPVITWDARGHRTRVELDALRRPVRSLVSGGALTGEILRELVVYGESVPGGERRNLRTRVAERRDGAGVATFDAYDAQGNLARTTRRLTAGFQDLPDWSGDVELEARPHVSLTRHDALNRPVELTLPDGTVQRLAYNAANLLERLDATLPDIPDPGGRPDAEGGAEGGREETFVAGVEYNARGQRVEVRHGNGVSTRYTYDPRTFRLVRQHTSAAGGAGARGREVLQDLRFFHDPAGNIVRAEDHARQDVFFRNRHVEPHASYRYDALYRLVEATGREHLGQIGGPPARAGLSPVPHPADGAALARYTQRFRYDPVGNLLRVTHRNAADSATGWTREYVYDQPSRLEPGRTGNRLGGLGDERRFSYDEHGDTVHLPGVGDLAWTPEDQISQVSRVADGGTQTTHYVYDASGRRVRAVTIRRSSSGPASPVHERVYLGGYEIARAFTPDGGVEVRRDTVHVLDGERRVALVETRAAGRDRGPVRLVRYQMDDQLGSARLELDDEARVLSAEEYHPYGTTALFAAAPGVEAPKRYRYTGKERDPETGLYYYGARYYAPWLGRWVSCDPAGLTAGLNRYEYVQGRPIIANDPDGAFLNFIVQAVVGAAIGAVVGGGVEAIRQLVTEGKISDWGRVGAAAAGGAVTGAIAGLTGGASLGVQAAGVAVGAAAGGIVTRAINGERQTVGAVVVDAAIGLVTFGVIKGAGAGIRALRAPAASGAASGGAAAGGEAAAGRAAGGGGGAGARSVATRAAAGEIPPKPSVPPWPEQFKNLNEFGKAFGWGSQLSREESRALARAFPQGRLQELGLTREMLEQWRAFYRYLERFEPRNPTAPGRAAFLDELMTRFFPTPGQAAAGAATPAAAGAVAAGAQRHEDDGAAPAGPASAASPGGGGQPGAGQTDQPGATPGGRSGGGGAAGQGERGSDGGPLQLRRRLDTPGGSRIQLFPGTWNGPATTPNPRAVEPAPATPVLELRF